MRMASNPVQLKRARRGCDDSIYTTCAGSSVLTSSRRRSEDGDFVVSGLELSESD